MALINVGSIPEDLTVTDVWEAHLDLDALPAVLFGRRATYDELIYDADIAGGFTANWAGFSSITPDDLGGFTLVLGRRAYSMAGLAVFAGTAGSGGGGGSTSLAGDVTGPSGSNTVVAIRGEAVPALAAGVLTFNGTDLAWTTPSGSGDVVGPSSSAADHIATFNGITGKLVKDGGKTIAQVEASAVATASASKDLWTSALDLDFSVQANQTIATGTATVGGVAFTAVTISTYSSLFAVVNGSGLEMKPNATQSGHYQTVRGFAHLKIRLSDLIPGFDLRTHQIRLSAIMTTTGQTSTAEVVQCGIDSWTYTLNANQAVRMVRGFIATSTDRRVDVWSGTGVEFDQTLPVTDLLSLTLENPAELEGSFSYAPSYAWASPVVWPDRKDDVYRKGFRANAKQTTAFLLTAPFWTVSTEPCLIFGVTNNNTLNNTTFKAIIRALKLEYRVR